MAVVGYWLFSESMGMVKGVSIAMIILGVVGLNVGDRLVPGNAADAATTASPPRR